MAQPISIVPTGSDVQAQFFIPSSTGSVSVPVASELGGLSLAGQTASASLTSPAQSFTATQGTSLDGQNSDVSLSSLPGSPTTIATTAVVTATMTPVSSIITNTVSTSSIPTATLIGILVPICVLSVSVPTIFFCLWQRRKQRSDRPLSKPEAKAIYTEASKSGIELDGTAKHELESRERVQEVTGDENERKELQAVEEPQELDGRRKSHKSSRFSRATVRGFHALLHRSSR